MSAPFKLALRAALVTAFALVAIAPASYHDMGHIGAVVASYHDMGPSPTP